MITVGIIFFVILVICMMNQSAKESRMRAEEARIVKQQKEKIAFVYNKLVDKYGCEETAKRIMKGEVWQGQTLEQLSESKGLTTAVTERVLKNSVRHTYKYNKIGSNRYEMSVTLDNGVVVGWKTNN